MPYLIPGDWDGESWLCVKLHWPDSDDWLSVLLGLVTSMARGRTWDGDTGSITETQAIGREIFERFWPMTACDSEPCGGNDEQAAVLTRILAGITIEGDGEMGQVVTDVQVVNGKLRIFFGHCCWEDLDLTHATVSQAEPATPDPDAAADLIDDAISWMWPPSGDWSTTACTKATKLVEFMESAIDTILDGVSSFRSPGRVKDDIRNDWPGMDFAELNFLNAYAAALNVEGWGLSANAQADDVFAAHRCALEQEFEAGYAGITEAQYNAARRAVAAVASDKFDFLTYPTAFNSLQSLHRHVCDMLGSEDARKLTQYLNAESGEDCSCPGETLLFTEPVGGYYLSPIMKPLLTFDNGCDDSWTSVNIKVDDHEHDVFGVVFELQVFGDVTSMKPASVDFLSECRYGDEWDAGWITLTSNGSEPGALPGRLNVIGVEARAKALMGESINYVDTVTWPNDWASPRLALGETGMMSWSYVPINSTGKVTVRNIRYMYNEYAD